MEKAKLVRELEEKLSGLINVCEVNPVSGDKEKCHIGKLPDFEISEIMAKVKEIAKAQGLL